MSGSRPSSTRRWRPASSMFMPWPYVEGLTMAEATNDLAFIVTGVYGKPLPKQTARRSGWRRRGNTASSRSSRSSSSASPTSGRQTFWEALGPDEYGFWANVNPAVPHPRWSQATETVLDDRRARADADLQRLRRPGRRPLQGARERAALHVSGGRALRYRQRCAFETRKSRNACTRATFFISSA